jgi:hypothetical protein
MPTARKRTADAHCEPAGGLFNTFRPWTTYPSMNGWPALQPMAVLLRRCRVTDSLAPVMTGSPVG